MAHIAGGATTDALRTSARRCRRPARTIEDLD
jgi:hypothetical protein